MDNLSTRRTQVISPGILDQLKVALKPTVLNREADRFDMGVEYQKDIFAQQLAALLGVQSIWSEKQ